MEDGLSALGYGSDDVDQLVEGALPQDRVNKLAPRYTRLFKHQGSAKLPLYHNFVASRLVVFIMVPCSRSVNKLAPKFSSLFKKFALITTSQVLPTPPIRYPLKEDLHDIYTNAMTVY